MLDKKYYVEFKCYDSEEENYDMQSKFFDTPEEAEKWFKDSFDYVGNTYVAIMEADWDEEDQSYGDIEEYKVLSD